MKVCIATPHTIGETETFIRAHLERLPHPIVHIHGLQDGCTWENQRLSEWYNKTQQNGGRWLNLLPRYIEFRMRRRYYPELAPFDVIAKFLLDQTIDVVLAEYGTAGAFVAPACRAADVPLVVHFHGFDASRHDVLEEYRERYEEMFHYASSVIVVSQQMYQDLVGLGCPAEKLVVSYYGPNPEFFRVTPDYRGDRILMVGRLTDKKAPHISLLAFREALKSCPELKLTIIGAGELEGVCKDLVQTLSLQEMVTFTGSLAPEQVREAMGDSFLFIQHSVRAISGDCEGTPVALLEAGAAGLPIVATRHAGIPDIFGPECGGILVKEKDLSAMANALVDMAKDRERAKAFGLANQQWIRENFSLEKHLGTIVDSLVMACTDKGN